MSTPTSREPDERPADLTTGQHASPRPEPPATTTSGATLGETTTGYATGTAGSGTGATAVYPATSSAETGGVEPVPPVAAGAAIPRAVEERRRDEVRVVEERDLPVRPPKPGVGRHLLGFVLGLVLTPVALLLTGIGTARLADVAGSGEPLTDALGITLLVIGVILLAVIVLLGAWTPAVPITGGLIWGIGLGLAFLIVPDVMNDWLEAMSADTVVPGGLETLAESAMSGYLLVTGTLLVASGIAAARARRRGRRWAEAVAAADAAQLDASRTAAGTDATVTRRDV
jgi:hypothetical protein